MTRHSFSLILLGLLATVAASCSKEEDPIETDNLLNGVWPNQDPEALTGTFTVNNTGKTVCFTDANLQVYRTSAGPSWHFWDHQYECSLSTRDVNDQLGWSNAKSDFGIDITDKRQYTSAEFVDWGTIWGKTGWRTLTKDELSYILFDRNTTVRYAKATIKYNADLNKWRNGLIIFPDGFECPDGMILSETDSKSAQYTTNKFTLEKWAILETMGCVFLPATGHSLAPNYYINTGTEGCYWTSSCTDMRHIYSLMFTENDVRFDTSYPFYGRAVRLAKDK